MTAKLIISNASPTDLDTEGNRRFARYVTPGERFDTEFSDGFEAGYYAQAGQRAVLGTPAYRQGHAYGVQCAVADRLERAERETPNHDRRNFWFALFVGVFLGLLLWGIFVPSARADTLANWNQLNEECQGGSGVTADKACTYRQSLATQLRREGWYQGAHGVWVSPEHVATFNRIVRHWDGVARANTGMLDSVMQALMEDLRLKVPPEALFALWNGQTAQLLANTPYAAAMLMHGLAELERRHWYRNDPRFRMVLRP